MKVVIAICGTRQYFGLPKYFYFLVKHLQNMDVDVEVILDSSEGEQHLLEVCGWGNVTVIGPECQGKWNTVNTAVWCWKVAQELKRRKFDVLHCGHVTPFFYLGMKERKAVVFQPFGNELVKFRENYGGLRGKLYGLTGEVLRSCGRRTDVLLAEGDWQRAEMWELYGRQSMVLPVGIDVEWAREQGKKAGVTREGLGLGRDDFVLLTVNAFHQHKGYDGLVEALRILPEKVKAVMVGTGPDEERVDKMVRGYGLEERVVRLRNVPEGMLYGLYGLADCYVSPAEVKDFQMGIAEAECFGLPIVSRWQEFMVDGNGFVVGKNCSSLVDGVRRMLDIGVHGRGVLGKRSVEVAEEWDMKKIAEKAVGIYEAVLG